MKRFLALESRDIVAVVSISMFMIQLDAAVMAIALPHIAADFERPTVSLSLAITIYLTMLVAVLPISGWAADRFGPRRIFMIASLCFGLFSLLCALAPSYWPFILARALQGCCASLMTPVARLILLKKTSKAELVDALSITAMPMLIAPTLGPSIGGFIIDYASWEYIFILNVPVSIFLAFAIWRRVEEVQPETRPPLDWRGALLLSLALIALLTGVDRLAGNAGHWLPWALLAAGTVLGLATWRHLKTWHAPIIPLDSLQIEAFRVSVVGSGVLIRIPARAALFALPLMLQMGFGFSAFAAGLLLIAMNGGDFVTKPFIKPMFDRFGFRGSIAAGSAAGIVALSAIAVAGNETLWIGIILVALVLAGISRSIVFTGIASLSYAALGERDMSAGNVLNSISMQLFNALAISGTALTLGLSSQLRGTVEPGMADFRFALVVLVVLGLFATVAMHRKIPRDLHEVHPEEPT